MDAESDAHMAAVRFRRDHGLGVQPLGDLVAVIEQATGIDVAVLDADPDEHGLTMRDPQRDVTFIGVARTRHPIRQRSSLAHELGHVVFEDWATRASCQLSRRNAQEIRADAFARHLLVPVDGLREFLGSRTQVTRAILSAVVQRFLVSPAIAAIALQSAGYIDAASKQEWMELSTQRLAVLFGWIDQYQALQAESDQRRAPQRLLARAIRGYADGVLPPQAIATLRGVRAEAIEAELREAGIASVEPHVAWSDAADLPAVDVDLVGLDEELRASDGPDTTLEPNG